MVSRFGGGLGLLAATKAPVAAAAPAGVTHFVTNGTFTGNDGTGWSGVAVVGGWVTFVGDKMVINNTSGLTKTLTYTFPVAPAAGLLCTIAYDVSGFVANGGGINQAITIGGGASAGGALIPGNGAYGPVTATAGGGGAMNFTIRNGMNLSIDNFDVAG